MAKSIKLGADTYLDASGVEMRSTSSAYRKTLADWADGLVGISRFNIPRNSSVNLTLSADTRVIIFFSSPGQNGNGIYYAYANADGTYAYTRQYVEASAVTITSSGNVLTLTNTRTDVTVFGTVLLSAGTISVS